MAPDQNSPCTNEVTTLDRRKMLILYGSETGNSEESAGDIESMARRLHFQVLVEEMNDIELSTLLRYPLIIFVISTTGQGDLPRNARKFWKSLLRKRLPPNCLRQVNFTTFGLGDSSYYQYNWAARKLHKRLEQLGAVEFLPRGEADERHEDGIDGTFLPWCLTLRTYLEKEWPLPPGLLPIPPDVQLTPKFTLELVKQDLTMDANNAGTANSDAMTAESTSEVENVIDPEGSASPQDTALYKETLAERRARYNTDNQGRKLDREAALFSHVDSSPDHIQKLKYQVEVEGRTPNKYDLVRLSDQLAERFPGGINSLDKPNVLKDAATKYSIEDSTETPESIPPYTLLPIPKSWTGVVHENTRLTPSSHWQDVRKLTIRIPEIEVRGRTTQIFPEPGDVAVIYPKNFTQDVQVLIDIMGWGDVADKPFRHVSQSSDIPYKTPRNCYPLENSTLRDLLIHNYDITCIPRRSFFTAMASYTEDLTHKERLREFADPGHSDEFWDYTSRPRRSILEVLQDFPSVQIPYQHVPSVFPVIRGREYSIASGGCLLSDAKHPAETMIDLVVALVKYKTVLRKTRQGLCSRYIASLLPGTPINITFRDTEIPDVISSPRTPLLIIAPGTGIAPIRALLHDRASTAGRVGKNRENVLLFYGGRNHAADFFFEEEWKSLGINVITAFSRDQPHKIYVQDRLVENYSQVCEFLKNGAAICLCGSSGKMPQAVRLALYDCMVNGGMASNREEARASLYKDYFFWEEVW